MMIFYDTYALDSYLKSCRAWEEPEGCLEKEEHSYFRDQKYADLQVDVYLPNTIVAKSRTCNSHTLHAGWSLRAKRGKSRLDGNECRAFMICVVPSESVEILHVSDYP